MLSHNYVDSGSFKSLHGGLPLSRVTFPKSSGMAVQHLGYNLHTRQPGPIRIEAITDHPRLAAGTDLEAL
jgi:hypothetical protein